MSAPSVSNLLRIDAPAAATRTTSADQGARGANEAADGDFARALERRIGNDSGNPGQPSQAPATAAASSRPTAPAQQDQPIVRRATPHAETESPREVQGSAEQPTSSQTPAEGPSVSQTSAGAATPPAPDAHPKLTPPVLEASSDAADPAGAGLTANTTSVGPASTAPTSTAAAVPLVTSDPASQPAISSESGEEMEAIAGTELPADTAMAANLAAMLQGVVMLPPQSMPNQPAIPATDETASAGLPATQDGSTRILSNVLATLQRDGLTPVPTSPKSESAETAEAASSGNSAAAARELPPTATPLRVQNPELLRSTPTPPVADQAAAIAPASSSPHTVPDAQALGLQIANLTASHRSEAAQIPQLPVHTQAGQPAWPEDVGNRVVWMLGRNESKAELVLTPAHLGKLEISIQVSGDQTTAHFVAATSAARDALEQALPRLREVLQQAGINLGQTNVSTSSDQRAQRDNQAATSGGARGDGREDTAVGEIRPTASTVWARAALGMVDTFA